MDLAAPVQGVTGRLVAQLETMRPAPSRTGRALTGLADSLCHEIRIDNNYSHELVPNYRRDGCFGSVAAVEDDPPCLAGGDKLDAGVDLRQRQPVRDDLLAIDPSVHITM
jgi:hypothetical protein